MSHTLERTPEQIELEQIDKQRKRFKYLTYLMIGVSIASLVPGLLLFSDDIIDSGAKIGAILGLELYTAALAMYIAAARRAGHPVGCSAWVLFIACLLVSFGLNTSHLWSKRPPPDKIPDLLAKSIAVVFGAFIPLSIYTGATIGGSLDSLYSTIQRRYAEEAMERERKAVEREARRTRIQERPPAALPAPSASNGVDTYTLDHLLDAAGLTRGNALETLAQYGMDSPHKAYGALRSRDKLPGGLDESTFTALWSELHAAPRLGNGKSTIRPDDVPAILAALRARGITTFKWQKDLCAPCDWSSETSAGKAIKNLLAAGALRQTAAGYEVV